MSLSGQRGVFPLWLDALKAANAWLAQMRILELIELSFLIICTNFALYHSICLVEIYRMA